MLSDVVVALRARLVAINVSAPVLIGRRHVRQTGNASSFAAADGGGRIVFVPADDEYYAGPTQDFNGPGGGPQNKILITRGAGARVHIWVPPSPVAADKDLDSMAKVEALTHIFLREWREILRGSKWVPTAAGWNNEAPETHAFGLEYVMTVNVDVPIEGVTKTLLPEGTTITTTASMGEHSSEEV